MTTTHTIQKFYDVTPFQLAALMRFIGGDGNTGEATFHVAWKDANGVCGAPGGGTMKSTFRHITLLSATQKENGLLSIEVKINTDIVPLRTKEVPHTSFAPEGATCHWSISSNHEPARVRRSLVLAMHDCLGIFLTA